MKYILYHYPICPFSRKIRFLLDEIDIKYKKEEVKTYIKNIPFIAMNPANETPVLKIFENNVNIIDSYIIADFLKIFEYQKIEPILSQSLFGANIYEILEINRLQMWFDKKFYNEVTRILINELFIKTFDSNYNNITNTNIINIIINNLNAHIEYIEFLLSKNKWLATDKFSLADLSAAAHISIIDYFGYINWKKHNKLKEWYIVIKSKKGFRDILNDKIIGFNPSNYYSQLDF